MRSIEESNKLVVKRWLEEGWNKRDSDVFFELLADNFINHCTRRDLEKMKTDLQVVFEQKHPRSRVTIDDMIAEGDKVALRITHLEQECDPRVELVFCRLRDERITDVWNCYGPTNTSE